MVQVQHFCEWVAARNVKKWGYEYDNLIYLDDSPTTKAFINKLNHQLVTSQHK